MSLQAKMAETLSLSSGKKLGHPGVKLGKLNPVARVLLQGIYDENSELHKLRGMWHILEVIWKLHIKHISYCKLHIKHDEASVLNLSNFDGLSYTSASIPSEIIFPNFTRREWNINMMPFLMESTFTKCILPEYLETYWRQLIRKCPIGPSDIGKVGYLTIQEGFVLEDMPKRRPGIHTAKPGKLKLGEKIESKINKVGLVRGGGYSLISTGIEDCGWGWGEVQEVTNVDKLEGGIFMASSVDSLCRVWECQIMKDDVIGEEGNIEYLRELLPNSTIIRKDYLYWLTDRTPYEFLKLKGSSCGQFFMLVTSQVSLWYEDHYTKNPLGVVPDPSITKTVRSTKPE